MKVGFMKEEAIRHEMEALIEYRIKMNAINSLYHGGKLKSKEQIGNEVYNFLKNKYSDIIPQVEFNKKYRMVE